MCSHLLLFIKWVKGKNALHHSLLFLPVYSIYSQVHKFHAQQKNIYIYNQIRVYITQKPKWVKENRLKRLRYGSNITI